MEEEFKRLAEEIFRIVTSPYAVSLKALHDLLRVVALDTLQQWAICNACQIDALAAAVVHSINIWPYTLEIVRILSSVISIRDAFLQQNPLLLPTLLHEATSTANGNLSQYMATSTCVSMLSAALPDTLPIPARLPRFTQMLLDKAVEKASADTLRPLYQVLKGVGATVLEIFPPEKLICLQNELIKLLRSLEDHSANLLCLAIFATLHTGIQRPCPSTGGTIRSLVSSQESESSTKVTAVEQMQDIIESARQFFGAKKASKTLDLVVLRTIQSCSIAPETQPARVVESFHLSKEILDAVDQAEKADWVQRKGTMVRKLYEKIRRTDTDIGISIRLAAFEVVGSLATIPTIPDDLVAVMERLLQRPLTNNGVEGIAKAYASRFSEDFILCRFTKALGAATASDYYPSENIAVSEITTLQILINSFVEAAQSSLLIRQTVLVAVSSNELQDVFKRFLHSKSPAEEPSTEHRRQGVCQARIQDLRWRLQRQLCHLLLRSAFYASSAEVALDPSLAVCLLQKATTVSLPLTTCQTYRPLPAIRLPSLSTSEHPDSPNACQSDQDWRTVLKEELDRDTAHRHGLMIRRVEHVCRELEARCNEVERPLNEERERSRSVQSKLDAYKEQCAELERAAEQQSVMLEGLEVERSKLTAEKERAELRAQHIAETLDDVSEQLRQANEEAARAACIAKDNLQRLELGHLAAMVAKEELLEEEAERTATLEIETKCLEDQLSNTQEELEQVRARLEDVLTDANDCEATIEDLKRKITLGRNDLEEQTNIVIRTSAELKSAKEGLASLESESINMRHQRKLEIEELNTRASKSLEDLERNMTAAKDDEISRLRSGFEDEIAALKYQFSAMKVERARLVIEHETRIADLALEIGKLNKEREIRDREFAEAQDLSSKLMAIMGHKHSFSTNPHTKSNPSHDPSVTEIGVMKDSDKVKTDVGQQHHSDSNSSSAGGSTPKRPRPRYSHKTASINQPNPPYQKPGMSIRKPLQDVGPNIFANRSPTRRHSVAAQVGEVLKSSRGSFENLVKESSPPDTEEASFAPGNIFTSTDFRNMDAGISMNSPDGYEETTADF